MLLATGSSFIQSLTGLIGAPEAKAWTGAPAEYTIHFYHTDHLGSTRVITDEDGEVYERIDYGPFGEIVMDSSAGPQDRFKFTGQMFDPITSLYYYGARYYDPEIGRFAQADTIVPRPLDGQTFNRYSYVNNNPYKYIDPSGHDFWSSFAGAFVGAIVTFITFPVLGLGAFILGAAVAGAVQGGIEASQNGGNIWQGMGIGALGGAVSAVIGLAIGPELALMLFVGQAGYALHTNDNLFWENLAGSLVGNYLGNNSAIIGKYVMTGHKYQVKSIYVPGANEKNYGAEAINKAGEATRNKAMNALKAKYGLAKALGAVEFSDETANSPQEFILKIKSKDYNELYIFAHQTGSGENMDLSGIHFSDGSVLSSKQLLSYTSSYGSAIGPVKSPAVFLNTCAAGALDPNTGLSFASALATYLDANVTASPYILYPGYFTGNSRPFYDPRTGQNISSRALYGWETYSPQHN